MTDQRAERPVVSTHAEAVAVAQDPGTYSSRVSRFLQVPNGMDGAEHAAMRRLLAPFPSPARVTALRPVLEETAAGLLDPLADGTALDAVGDLGSLALCAGVVVGWLVADGSRQDEWRGLDDASLDAAIDEVLRIDDPFTSNRRVTTREARVAGHEVPAGTQLVIDWTRANRDPAGNADRNLVYGTGPHACPGRSLATLELRVLTRALLSRFRLESGGQGVRALFPLGGWESLPVVLRAPRPATHPSRTAR